MGAHIPTPYAKGILPGRLNLPDGSDYSPINFTTSLALRESTRITLRQKHHSVV